MGKKARERQVKKIEKRYGSGTVVKASEGDALLQIPRIPFQIFLLDFATSGGIPRGRISMFYGPESSGKSAMALKVVASAQMICRDCGKYLDYQCECKDSECLQTLWLDAEGVFDSQWSERLGADPQHIYVVQTEYAEQGIDIVDAMLRDGEFDLIVVDSVAHLTPTGEIENSTEKWQVGLQARLCIAEGQLVTTTDGRVLPIEDVQPEDELTGLNPDSQAPEPVRVVDAWSNGEQPVININDSLRLTANHPVLTPDGWVPVEELKIGDRIARLRTVPSGDEPIDQAIRWEQVETLQDGGMSTVYDLEVTPHHNFSLDGYIVHNCNKAMRKWVSSFNAKGARDIKKPTILLINHIRKTMARYGSPETRPGGLGQRYATSVDIRFRAGKYWFLGKTGTLRKTSPGETAHPVKVDIAYKTKKCKVGPPRAAGELEFWLQDHEGHEVGDTGELDIIEKYAKRFKLLKQDGNTWKYRNIEGDTKAELMGKILDRPGGVRQWRHEVLEAMFEITGLKKRKNEEKDK